MKKKIDMKQRIFGTNCGPFNQISKRTLVEASKGLPPPWQISLPFQRKKETADKKTRINNGVTS